MCFESFYFADFIRIEFDQSQFLCPNKNFNCFLLIRLPYFLNNKYSCTYFIIQTEELWQCSDTDNIEKYVCICHYQLHASCFIDFRKSQALTPA